MRNTGVLLVFILAIAFAALAYFVSSHIVVQGVDDIEIRQAAQSMNHMRERLQFQLSQFAVQIEDYASSDAFYEDFTQHAYPKIYEEFVESQFENGFLQLRQQAMLLFFDPGGKFLALHEVGKNKQTTPVGLLDVTGEVVDRLFANVKHSISGLIEINGEPYGICAVRIQDRAQIKPAQGAFVFVKSLGREFRSGSETNSFVRFSILPKESYDVVPSEALVGGYKILEVEGAFFVYAKEKDVFDNDIFCVEMRGERLLTGLAVVLARKNFFFMLGIGLLLLASTTVILHIVERNVMRREIRYRMSHDGTTGLLNKSAISRSLEVCVQEAIKKQQIVGVFFLNFDRFRGINEKYGYQTGDNLLFSAAERLRNIGSQLHLARYEGDKFCIVALRAKKEDITILAQKVVDVIGRPFYLENLEFSVTASVGVAFYPDDATTATDLLRRSEIAMYHAQKQGRGRICLFTEAMEDEATRRVSMQHALIKALADTSLKVYYQPKVNVQTKRVSGYEALVRWRNHDAWVPPVTFIPLAEEIGLVVDIDMFVLRIACRQIKYWQAQGIAVPIAVNMSSKTILSEKFADRVQQILQQEDVPSSLIEVEITETSLMTDLNFAAKAIKRLHDAGVLIALDDFGTGYSSLRYLHTMPISTLKIDKSFIDGLNKKAPQENSAELVGGIVALATGLGKEVVVEGVEDHAQMDFVTSLGCRIIQGYLFSKPLPEEEATEYLLSQTERIQMVLAE